MNELTNFSIKAEIPEDKEEEQERVSKLRDMNDVDFNELLQNAYRRADINYIDSIDNMLSGKTYRKYIVFERNKNFVRRIDSFMKNGQSIFAAFGVAHLPGDQGVIHLLEAMGYKLRPINAIGTSKSQKNKAKIDKMIYDLNFTRIYSPDSFISVSMPDKYVELSHNLGFREYFCPDMVNGSYYTVMRINTYSPLFRKTSTAILESIDSQLYFQIPES